MNSKRVYYLVVFFCIPWVIYAQGIREFYNKPVKQGNGFSLRAGLTYAVPTVTAYYISSNIPTSILWGVRPNTGFYAGGSYYTDLTANRLSLRVDATFRLKQTKTVDPLGPFSRKSRYYYLGLSPMLGLHLTKRFTVFTGAEANLLIFHQNSWGNGYPLDLGPTLRSTYTFGHFKVEIGYYRGFVKYDNLDIKNLPGGPAQHDFYNQTWEAGLIYNLK